MPSIYITVLSILAATTQVQTLSALLFYLFAGISAACALGVVLSRNIVRTAICLLFTLLGVAGLYFLLESEFLAAVQLVVYAGGTLILIIFGVMLTSKSPFSHFEPKLGEIVVAASVCIVLLAALVMAIQSADFRPQRYMEITEKYPVGALGQALLGDYLVPFELASVLLLVVMIGAAYLAKARRKDEKPVARGSAALSQKTRQWS
jgi:NADH:ubiquinone oxidoreductase subunit 6 (subunit J)